MVCESFVGTVAACRLMCLFRSCRCFCCEKEQARLPEQRQGRSASTSTSSQLKKRRVTRFLQRAPKAQWSTVAKEHLGSLVSSLKKGTLHTRLRKGWWKQPGTLLLSKKVMTRIVVRIAALAAAIALESGLRQALPKGSARVRGAYAPCAREFQVESGGQIIAPTTLPWQASCSKCFSWAFRRMSAARAAPKLHCLVATEKRRAALAVPGCPQVISAKYWPRSLFRLLRGSGATEVLRRRSCREEARGAAARIR